MTAPTPNAELAYAVLDQIDAHPERWDQSWWLIATDCGTSGCFAGWTCMLAGDIPDPPEPLSLMPVGEVFNMVRLASGDGYAHASDRAAELLGLADDRADKLFGAKNTREDLGRLVAEIFGPRPAPLTLPRYVMATAAHHKLGDISRDEPDLAIIDREDGDDYVGQWVTGAGYIEVRFPKATTRELTEAERDRYRGRHYGVHSWAMTRIEFDDDVPPNAGSAS